MKKIEDFARWIGIVIVLVITAGILWVTMTFDRHTNHKQKGKSHDRPSEYYQRKDL